MLRLLNSFRPGDVVRVREHFGRVTESGLFHTEIQTEDRDLTTLPNLHLVCNPVPVVHSEGTMISMSVSLGCDVDHRPVENLLREAAKTNGLKDSCVHVMELRDYSVTYRASGFLEEVKQLLTAPV